MTWWQRFLNWLGVSQPGGRREQVENWLASNQTRLQNFFAKQNDRKLAKGHFFQRLKGWARPTDNDDDPENDFAGQLPAWSDVSVDVWEAPVPGGSQKGWTLRIFVTEADGKTWVISYDSSNGPLGWRELPVVQ